MPRLPLLGLLAVLLCGCSQFRGDLRDKFALRSPLIHGETSTDANRVPYIAAKAREFAAAHQAAAARPTDPLAISRYVGTGITYSQLLCADYFDRQVYAQAHRNFARSEMNLSAGLASTLLGLAKASATGVAATGALFSFTEASFDAFDGAYLVSPELADLERLVREKLREEEVVIYRKLYADARLHSLARPRRDPRPGRACAGRLCLPLHVQRHEGVAGRVDQEPQRRHRSERA